jgi:hypothetical protein
MTQETNPAPVAGLATVPGTPSRSTAYLALCQSREALALRVGKGAGLLAT